MCAKANLQGALKIQQPLHQLQGYQSRTPTGQVLASFGKLTSSTLTHKKHRYLLTLIDTFYRMDGGTPHLQKNSRCDGLGTPGTHHPLIWHAIPPSSWDLSAGTVSPGSSRYLTRISGLASNWDSTPSGFSKCTNERHICSCVWLIHLFHPTRAHLCFNLSGSHHSSHG